MARCATRQSSPPDAEITIKEAEAKVETPSRDQRPAAPAPTDRRYDPYDRYYPSPLGGLFTMMLWGSMLSWAMMPHYTIINPAGTPLGATDTMSHESMAATAGGEDMGSGFGADGFGADEFGGDGGFDFGDW